MAHDRGSVFVSRRGVLGWFSVFATLATVADTRAAPIARHNATAMRDSNSDGQMVARLIALELEASAYLAAGLSRFASDEGTSGDRIEPSQPTLVTIWQHDRGHLALLKSSALALGESELENPGTAIEIGNFAAFLWTLAKLKAASVSAYVAAVPEATDSRLRSQLARILAVEARHAAYLNARIGEPPFTGALEEARALTRS